MRKLIVGLLFSLFFIGTVSFAQPIGVGWWNKWENIKYFPNPTVASSEKVTNLNADLLDGEDWESITALTASSATITNTLIADLYKEYSGNVIFVGQGGAYTKLSDAINSITDASSSKRYCVVVKGKIVDDTTIVAKSWVDVIGFGADITVQTDSNVHGVDFYNITSSLWKDLIIRRKGNVTSSVYAGSFRGTTDETVVIRNVEFRNEITAAVNYCHGIAIWNSASPQGEFVGYGGDGGNNCRGIAIWNSASPWGTFIGYGGDGGNNCHGIRISDSASPQGEFVGSPQKHSYDWSYTSANNGQFQPFSGKPYQLIGIAVYVSSAASAGVTLDLGTSIGGSEIASGIPLDSTGWKHFDFNRVEVASNGYMYATPSASVTDGSFSIHYVVMVNYSDCYGLYLDTKGFANIQGNFYANGASDALCIGSNAVSVKNWRIDNSHFETYDPTNQRAVYASSSITDCPIYNSTFVGSIVNVTSFAPQVQHDLLPDTDNSYNLGSATKRFGEGFFGGSIETPEVTTSSGNLTLSPASGEVEWTSVWQEQRAHVTQFYKPGTNYPGEGEIGITPVLLFDASSDKWAYYEWEVPENYHVGSDIKLRFAWAPTDTSTGSVVWATEYTIITPNNNEVLTATATTKTVTDSAESLANELLLTDFITISGTGIQSGDIISMRIFRDADNGADDYGADAALVHIGLYFQIDRNGVASP